MADCNLLKQELLLIERVFHKSHDKFQLIRASLEEVLCRFICTNGNAYEITGTITPNYPEVPPVWFTEADENSIVTKAVALLSSTSGLDNHVTNQVAMLVRALCRAEDLPEPEDLEKLKLDNVILISGGDVGLASSSSNTNSTATLSTPSDQEMDLDPSDFDDYDEDDDDISDDDDAEFEAEFVSQSQDKDGLDNEQRATLDKLKTNQQAQSTTKGSTFGSIQASDRLMKELKEIYRSDTFKAGNYSVELINDNLYDWTVKLRGVDKDSPLYADLQTLKQNEGKDYIELHMTFKDNFPFEPPFVRVVHPRMTGGYVLSGGAICMELLTAQGWSSVYTVEAVIMQIAATFVRGKARIVQVGQEGASAGYTLAGAQQSYNALVRIHKKGGWYTPPKADG